jgi:hypothetical protein
MKTQLRITVIEMRDDEEYTNAFLEAEIEDLQYTRDQLTIKYDSAVDSRNTAKQKFDEEKNDPENSKDEGQPVREQIEAIMKDAGGINFADFHGREMQGPACRKFLEKRDEIVAGIKAYIQQLPEAQKLERDNAVTFEMLDLHRRLLGHLDAFFSFLKAPRFTIAMDGVEYDKADMHRDQFKKLWWYLKIPRTPKYHLGGDHALILCKRSKGIGENAEDEGERGHQTGARAERRYGNMSDHEKKTKSMNNFEVMEKDPRVREIQEEMCKKTKRNFKNPRESADDRSAEAREARATKRDALLTDDFQMPNGEMVTLRDRKKMRMLLDRVA